MYSSSSDQVDYKVIRDGNERKIEGFISIVLQKFDIPIEISGTTSRGRKTLKVEYLSPISLQFLLPHDYPSFHCPKYSLQALWLNSKLEKRLKRRLDDCWIKNIGAPILYLWIQTIEEEVVNAMKSNPIIDLDSFMNVDQKFSRISHILREIMDFDENATRKEFERNFHECGVCWELKIGSDLIQFFPCKHIFCQQCTTAYYKDRLKNFTICRLECLEENCNSFASDEQLRLILSEEERERYDQLLLEGALDLMADIVKCPRKTCNAPILVEEIREGSSSRLSTLATCPLCDFSFCTLCQKTYHGLAPCSVDEEKRDELLEKYYSASNEERELLYKQYGGRRIFEKFIEDQESAKFIKESTKPCPNCGANIQKNMGCNKIYCTKCGRDFCWLCNAQLSSTKPYDHFNMPNGCFNRLFEGSIEINSDEEEEEEEEDFDMRILL
ncbi:unnamed protein product [Dracunculus medinensis]|uniref:RBR-type E3 ubiquitin transferase n=1 Tax=Dracunculus medinensis TaxID=318479 RepID=A0A0N4UKM6_DRAME|nr:unnamed protein product [Dracunculus medinensis]